MNLCDALTPKSYEEGECIIRQGDKADGMYFIEDGCVRITKVNEVSHSPHPSHSFQSQTIPWLMFYLGRLRHNHRMGVKSEKFHAWERVDILANWPSSRTNPELPPYMQLVGSSLHVSIPSARLITITTDHLRGEDDCFPWLTMICLSLSLTPTLPLSFGRRGFWKITWPLYGHNETKF